MPFALSPSNQQKNHSATTMIFLALLLLIGSTSTNAFTGVAITASAHSSANSRQLLGRAPAARPAMPSTPSPSALVIPPDCIFVPLGRVGKANWKVVNLAAGLRCINSIKVSYINAVSHVLSLSDVFQEYYVFVDIAKDPGATPQANLFNLSVFSEKVDLVSGLRALADSWPTARPVGVADVQLQVNQLFNRLRDNHVLYMGLGVEGTPGTSFGGVLDQYSFGLWDSQAKSVLGWFDIVTNVSNKSVVGKVGYGATPKGDLDVQERVIKTVNGSSLLDWIVQTYAQNPAFPLKRKSVGARVNSLIQNGLFYKLSALGDVGPLSQQVYDVEWADGGKTQWSWVVLFPDSDKVYNISALTNLVNQAGMPYQAFTSGTRAYTRLTSQTAPTAKRELRAPWAAPLPAKSKDPWVQTICCDSDGELVGEYTVRPNQPAVLKLKSFDYDAAVYAKAWSGLVKKATAANVTNLILDLTGNSGGFIQNGIYAAKGLYPSIRPNPFDRIIGPAAQYLISNALDLTSINATMTKLLTKPAWLKARTAQINANSTDLQDLNSRTQGSLKFVQTLLGQTSLLQSMGGCLDALDCRFVWALVADFAANLKTISQQAVDSPSGLTPPVLRTIIDTLLGLMYAINPYTIQGGTTPYLKPLYQYRGGVNTPYTQKFFSADNKTLKGLDPLPPTHPFKKIIAVTDGLCDSTCDQFTRAAWFYSLVHSEAPTFRYATFGGTGKPEDISATSAAGGNVADADYMTQGWAYNTLLNTATRWTGESQGPVTWIERGDR